MSTPIWFPSDELIAGLSHAGWGALVVVSFALFGHFLLGLLLMAGFAAGKEFVFDKYVEKQTFGNNLTDFAEYVMGFGLATLLCYFSHHIF